MSARTLYDTMCADHTVHTEADPVSRLQVDTLDADGARHDITEFAMNDRRPRIVHVIGPEHGTALPGMTMVCVTANQHDGADGLADFVEVKHIYQNVGVVAAKERA